MTPCKIEPGNIVDWASKCAERIDCEYPGKTRRPRVARIAAIVATYTEPLVTLADCVMAGMARSGSVYPLQLGPEILERAFQNTVTLLKDQVVVEDPPSQDQQTGGQQP